MWQYDNSYVFAIHLFLLNMSPDVPEPDRNRPDADIIGSIPVRL